MTTNRITRPSARQAYYTNESFVGIAGRYHVARIVEGEAGYFRSRETWGTVAEAQAEVDSRNARLGVSRADALRIVASSMSAPR